MPPVKDIAETIGIAVAVVTLSISVVNTSRARKIERAKFWLDLRDRLAKFQDVNVALRPEGVWGTKEGITRGCPATDREWSQLEAYMGLIEHCGRMIDDWVLDWETFRRIYGYRIGNIAANHYVAQQKLIEARGGWETFVGLTERLGIKISGTNIPPDKWPGRPLPASPQTYKVILAKDSEDGGHAGDEQGG